MIVRKWIQQSSNPEIICIPICANALQNPALHPAVGKTVRQTGLSSLGRAISLEGGKILNLKPEEGCLEEFMPHKNSISSVFSIYQKYDCRTCLCHYGLILCQTIQVSN